MTTASPPTAPAGAPDPSTPWRPSAVGSLAAHTVDDLLAPHADLLRRIKLCYGAGTEAFDRDILSAVQRYAWYVQHLPATRSAHFTDPGGLLRLGLEIGFFALQGTDSHIFAGRSSIATRRELEPRWRLAAFLSGLFAELHRALGSLSVLSLDQRQRWQPYLGPLGDWLAAQPDPHFLVRWSEDARDTRLTSVYALPFVTAPGTMQWLACGNNLVVPHMLAAIAGLPTHPEHNVLDSLVRRAAALVVHLNRQARGASCNSQEDSAFLSRYFMAAMHQLLASDTNWHPNSEKSRVWHGPDGLFLVWPAAGHDLIKILEADGIPGCPRDPAQIAQMLLLDGMARAHGDGSPLWPIHPPSGKSPVQALRLSSADILFSDPAQTPPLLSSALLRTEEPAPTHHETDRDSQPQASQRETSSPRKDDRQTRAVPRTRERSTPAALRLLLPLRIPAPLRSTLQRAVETLSSGPPQVALTPDGIFVPIAALREASKEVPLMLRALIDAGVLAASTGGSWVVQGEVQGSSCNGVVVAAHCVADWNRLRPDPGTVQASGG